MKLLQSCKKYCSQAIDYARSKTIHAVGTFGLLGGSTAALAQDAGGGTDTATVAAGFLAGLSDAQVSTGEAINLVLQSLILIFIFMRIRQVGKV